MTNDEYTSLVENGQVPADSEVPLDEPFIDERGIIQNLVLKSMNSVVVITSKKGSIRANHYHKSDNHYCYLISGQVLYFERNIGDSEIPLPEVFDSGHMFFTPSNREHSMLFTEDSVMITMAKNVRTHEQHEADLVRVEFITPELAKRYL